MCQAVDKQKTLPLIRCHLFCKNCIVHLIDGKSTGRERKRLEIER